MAGTDRAIRATVGALKSPRAGVSNAIAISLTRSVGASCDVGLSHAQMRLQPLPSAALTTWHVSEASAETIA
jgi:hypothetical protein